ncbi:Aminodeoxyfutalosine deaminase [Rosistilla carotiformis]|uniref:Aminodeoxyfutalosine deaminase n=1 Tax=Rosistilla carotiformis TaxID=2528017 RepID=A0A518JYE6_9BACT|nr:amidohydrolase family protein [Rosistilla carotiformis]QDV70568.1 Aminodeoxyfutalosine deaminase [Rosistilla carotiformis]
MSLSEVAPINYRARWIVPVAAPVVHDGVISIASGRIVSVESYRGQSYLSDLGDVAILPGLVNAHTHLEFSDLATPIGTAGMSIADWLPEVVCARRQQQLTQDQRTAAILKGIDEVVRTGTALLGEIATKPWPYEAVVAQQSLASDRELRIVAFCEVLGLSPGRQQELLDWAETQIAGGGNDRIAFGISPHAPYSVPPALLESCIDRARSRSIPLAIHLAESLEERRFIESGDGPLRETFESLGLPGLEQYPLAITIDQMIQRVATAPRGLLVHGNYLSADEIQTIASHHQRLSVVYCPRTHAFFDHAPHPVADLMAAGVRVALGTDSRASNPDLDLWNEVRHLLRHRQDLDPRDVVAMATRHGADALGQPTYGRLQPGSDGHLFVLKTAAATEASLWETLLDAQPIQLLGER